MYKVFIADDEEIICMGISKTVDWESLDCQVVGLAYDGEEALKMVRLLKPDLVLLDINMPFLTGVDVAGILYKEMPQTKIIMLTAFQDFNYAHQAIKYHVYDYLTKPCINSEIYESVKGAIKELRRDAIISEKVDEEEEKRLDKTEQIIDYIQNHFSDPELNLKGVASDLFISTSYLQTLLKGRDTSFSDLLNKVRMEKAMEILQKRENVKIYEVAYEVGLNTPQYFSSKFKRYYGVEPKNAIKNKR